MQTTELRLTRGSSETYTLTFKDGSGTVYDISSWLVFFTLKESYDIPDADASLQKMAVHSDPTNGVTQITLVSTDTDSLDVGEYVFDVKAVTDDNAVVTVLKGSFVLEWNVTKRITIIPREISSDFSISVNLTVTLTGGT